MVRIEIAEVRVITHENGGIKRYRRAALRMFIFRDNCQA